MVPAQKIGDFLDRTVVVEPPDALIFPRTPGSAGV
jgi:hypothetical protein